MGTWHPPIPPGRLYSAPAIQLGPALALLVWCYDNIQRDATIEVDLQRVTREIGKPYGTIRDWWRMLREGPFFCEQLDRGKRGWVVRMTDDWIDWRVMAHNEPDPVNAEMSALTERRDVSVEDEKPPVKAASKRRQRRDVSVETSAYKEDHHDHKTTMGENAQARARAPVSLDFMHEGVTTYKRLTGKRNVPPTTAAQIAEIVTDIPQWEKVITAWCGKYRPENVNGMLDWYQHPEKMGQTNGTHQTHRSAYRNGRPDPPSRAAELKEYLASIPKYDDDD